MISFLALKILLHLRSGYLHEKRIHVQTLFVIKQIIAASKHCTRIPAVRKLENAASFLGDYRHITTMPYNPLTTFYTI